MLGIVLYVWFRFQNVVFGFASVIALLHDVAITVVALAVSGYLKIDRVEKTGIFGKADYELTKLKDGITMEEQLNSKTSDTPRASLIHTIVDLMKGISTLVGVAAVAIGGMNWNG